MGTVLTAKKTYRTDEESFLQRKMEEEGCDALELAAMLKYQVGDKAKRLPQMIMYSAVDVFERRDVSAEAVTKAVTDAEAADAGIQQGR